MCELCREPVLSKCGQINIHHWSHRSGTECDSWHESETDWHKNWKKQFSDGSQEVVISQDGKCHRADVHTLNWISGCTHVIEFQHSPLEIGEIRERECFYSSMCWVIDATCFKPNLIIKEVYDRDNERIVYFDWKWLRRSWVGAQRDVYLDTGEELWRMRRLNERGDAAADIVNYHQFLSQYNGATGENLPIRWKQTRTGNLKYDFGFGHVLIYRRSKGGYGISVLREGIDERMNHRRDIYPTIEDAKRKCEPHIGMLMRRGRDRAERELDRKVRAS